MASAKDLDVTIICDGEQTTARKYLYDLLFFLWWEEEGFNSKRPFGNNGWQLDLMHGLVRANLFPGKITIDEDDIEEVEYDEKAADQYVWDLIGIMCGMK